MKPDEKSMIRGLLGSKKSSQDDMLLDFKIRTSGRILVPIKIDPPSGGNVSRTPSACSTPATPSLKHTPKPSPSPVASSSRPDTSKKSGMSTAFKAFEYNPVRREGRGPKKIKDDLDRTFAISSTKAVSVLKRKMEEKAARETKKATRGKG